MHAIQRTGDTSSSLTPDLWSTARYYLGGRRGLLILAGVTVAAGLALNWSWLAAVGAAPLIVALLPCAAMCALGLCMSRKSAPGTGASGSGAVSASPVRMIEHMPTKE